MVSATNILFEKLEIFIRKYYKNQLLKGLILSVSISLLAFFLISILEYFGRFDSLVRLLLFSLYMLSCLGILFWYMVRPLGGLINISRKLNPKKAAQLIGTYFPEVRDKLLNTLELQEITEHTASNSLLIASIEQKTSELRPIPFSNAIKFRSNLRYVKLALFPSFILLLILLVSPGFKGSSERIVKFNQHFEIEAPFKFIVDEGIFQTVQNRDLKVPLSLKGDEIPRDAYIHIGNLRYKMNRDESGTFHYLIRNVQKGSSVYFEAGGFSSRKYLLDVALRPSLLAYNAILSFPAYLGLDREEISNIGEITIPEGTAIQWNFETRNVDEIVVSPEEQIISNRGNRNSFSKIFKKSTLLKVKTRNANVKEGDSLYYSIQVIPDAFPRIEVELKNDSLSAKRLYFLGEIWDDHGFSKLTFHYKFTRSKQSREHSSGNSSISIDNTVQKQSIYHFWNLESLQLQADEEIEYYFTISDNDGVNGAKSTRTQVGIYKAPSLRELKEQSEKSNAHIKSSLSGAQKQATEIKSEMDKIQKMLTEKKSLDWNDKQKIEELLKKHEELQKEIQKTVDENMENNMKQEEFNKADQEMLEKKRQLEELFEQVMDEETKELMEKIRKLMEENRTEELQQMMQDLQFSQQEMAKDLERMLELFKELELEQKLNETIAKLNELSKKQDELAQESQKTQGKDEKLIKEQDSLNSEFDDAMKDLEDIEQKNQALEKPKDIKTPSEQGSEVQNEMKQGMEQLQKGKNSKASEQQKSAAEKMQKMADDLQAQKDKAYEEQQQEDYNSLRQILENLIQLSFDQEQVIEEFKTNRNYNARYVELRQLQRRLTDESKMVEDSLLALSKRNPVIEHFVNEEIAKVNMNLDMALAHLGERRTSNALVNQQRVMTGYNTLALMLAESLKSMQEQMKEQQDKKNGQCKNPGDGEGKSGAKPNAQTIKKMQDELNQQLKELMDGEKSGNKPSSQQFAEFAAKQAALRKQLQDLERQLQKDGQSGALGDLQKTQDLMDDIEKDLYNKQLNPELMKKLEELEIRLSEHEKAQRKQEQDEQRSSEEGEEKERPVPPHIQKYLDEKLKEIEMLRAVSPELQPYYKQKVKKYFGS